MDTIIINQDDVAALLSMGACIDAMEGVLRGLELGECELPLRQIMWLPGRVGALGLMPSYWSAAATIGLKAVTYFPGNEGTSLDSHQGAVLLYDATCGRLVAMVDATSITAIRTAAVSAVATKLLARDDAATLAIIGSGVQASMHLDAMLLCRRIEHVRVCSKTPARASAFAAAHGGRPGVTVESTASVEAAVRDADIICTTTSSSEPVLMGDWLRPGMHINAVGSSTASARELDARAVARCRLFVDRRASAVAEAGDVVLAKADGAIGDDHILGEIGEVLEGKTAGRTARDDMTLFKSVGLAVEDLAAAVCVVEEARRDGAGLRVAFGGARRATD